MKKILFFAFILILSLFIIQGELKAQRYKEVILDLKNTNNKFVTRMHPTPLSDADIYYEDTDIIIQNEYDYKITIEWKELKKCSQSLEDDYDEFILDVYEPNTKIHEVGDIRGYKTYGTFGDDTECYVYVVENKQYRFYIWHSFGTPHGEDVGKDIVNFFDVE